MNQWLTHELKFVVGSDWAWYNKVTKRAVEADWTSFGDRTTTDTDIPSRTGAAVRDALPMGAKSDRAISARYLIK